jgi:hypothetical protein
MLSVTHPILTLHKNGRDNYTAVYLLPETTIGLHSRRNHQSPSWSDLCGGSEARRSSSFVILCVRVCSCVIGGGRGRDCSYSDYSDWIPPTNSRDDL